MSDIGKQLDDLDAAGAHLHSKLGETEQVLNSVEEKINDFKRRQEERMTRDNRVNERLLKEHQVKAQEKRSSESE